MQATESHQGRITIMGINSQSDIAANLQIGPTDQGMVRIYLQGEGIDLPLDFDPEEAAEIAEELLAAAEAARDMGKTSGKPKKPRR
jgi:phage tail sheath gpL-like